MLRCAGSEAGQGGGGEEGSGEPAAKRPAPVIVHNPRANDVSLAIMIKEEASPVGAAAEPAGAAAAEPGAGAEAADKEEFHDVAM